ncbi:hypothetical protein ACT7DA_21170 [Bacillus pacificus]
MTIIWKKWSDDVVNEHHKNIYYYRDLYEGITLNYSREQGNSRKMGRSFRILSLPLINR